MDGEGFMAKHGKKYRAIRDKAPKDVQELDKAIDFLKANPGAGFDETMELGFVSASIQRSRNRLFEGR